jgi:hypothetical protein
MTEGPDLSGYHEAMDSAARQLAARVGIPERLLARRDDDTPPEPGYSHPDYRDEADVVRVLMRKAWESGDILQVALPGSVQTMRVYEAGMRDPATSRRVLWLVAVDDEGRSVAGDAYPAPLSEFDTP